MMTRRQRYILGELAKNGQIWLVSDAEEPADDPKASWVLAVFRGGDLLLTEHVQVRTLLELHMLAGIDVPGW